MLKIKFNIGDRAMNIDETFVDGSTNAVESREIQRRFGLVENRATALENAETPRATAETARVSAENTRVSQETGRVNAETLRVTAENARVAAELLRVSAENKRINDFSSKADKTDLAGDYTADIVALRDDEDQIAAGFGRDTFLYKSGTVNAASGCTTFILPITSDMKKLYYRSYLSSTTYAAIALKTAKDNVGSHVVYVTPQLSAAGWQEGYVDLSLYPTAKYFIYSTKTSSSTYRDGSYLRTSNESVGHDISELKRTTDSLGTQVTNLNAKAVLVDEVTYTDTQKAQARTNIGASSTADLEAAKRDIGYAKGESGSLGRVFFSLVNAAKNTYTTLQSLMIDSSGVIVTGSSASYSLYYVQVSKGDAINVFGTNSAAKVFRAGFCSVIPALGVEVQGLYDNGSATYANSVITAPSDGYVVVYHYSGYFADMSFMEMNINAPDTEGTLTANSVKSGCRLILTDGSVESVGTQYKVSTYAVPNASRMALYATGRVTSNADSCGVAYYGEDMSFLGYEVSGFSAATSFVRYRLTPASGTRFIKVQTNTNYLSASLEVLTEGAMTSDILTLNPKEEMLPKIKGISKRYYTTSSDNIDKPTVIAHISDIHGNWGNVPRFLKFCAEYEDYIDLMVNTGDTVASYFSDGIAGYAAVDGVEDILNVIGNHDTRTTDGWQGKANSTDVYNAFIAPYVADWGVTQPENAAANGLCYFYKDIVNTNAPSLRIVFVDCMGYNATQDTWLSSVLEDAATRSYHVVIMTHMAGFQSATGAVMEKIDCGYSSLKDLPENASGFNYYNAYGSHLTETVQSFIDDGGCFAGYIAGHHHYQFVARLTNYPKQLVFVIGCTKATETYDFTYDVGERNQDNFQLVSIDTYASRIKLLKVGANFDSHARHIDTVCISYDSFGVVADTYTDGSARKQMSELSGKVDANASKVGDLSSLATTDKTSIVNAVNELRNNIISTLNTAV